ncbi:hypothetical protein IE81DRAFT_321021 [Ceraceosorus guamensis]|uniref:Uncharacterized protein n=1 Tax=Ceraceosorus guamensis TaxID=1522189 RepID=A0A316W458_9BASI|nr:hypothetical protein IE81DRAFT_321021 [Ceraceosorus guamensis]PWN44707.1 hypothetical protein IE81DRAFT_321021 [Ceraceosorus guamensis]
MLTSRVRTKLVLNPREWAFLLPAWNLVAVLVTYTVFMSLNLYGNGDLADLSKVVGESRSGHLTTRVTVGSTIIGVRIWGEAPRCEIFRR